jgi:hypothetical protein
MGENGCSNVVWFLHGCCMALKLINILLVCAGMSAMGCNSPANKPDMSALPSVSISAQLKARDEVLVGRQFRNILDFERTDDAVFVSADTVAERDMAHTGGAAILAERGRVDVYLNKLLPEKSRAGQWTLAGAYCRAKADGLITVELLSADTSSSIARHAQRVPAGAWIFCAVDLTALPSATDLSNTTLRLTASSAIAVDDVLLVNNRRVLCSSIGVKPWDPFGWRIEQVGLHTRVDAPGRFAYDIDGSSGWSVVEANAIRVRADKGPGDARNIVLYADGRFIENAHMRVLNNTADAGANSKTDIKSFVALHIEPAELNVDEAGGRVDRTTPGDVNNDGYNERVGAYCIAAVSGRVSFVLAPAGTALVNPVIHIQPMPPGNVVVMVEGVLFDTAVRLPDTGVLVMLPVTLQRPTRVSVKIVR